MPQEIFLSVARRSPLGTRSQYTVPFSVMAHTLLIGTVIVVPLVATGTIPLPSTAMLFAIVPAVQPPAPLVESLVRPQVEVSALNRDAAPIQAPRTFTAELPPSIAPLVHGIPSVIGPANAGVLAAPPRPIPDVNHEPRRVGGDIKEPKKTHDVAPVYPVIAKAAHIEGMVLIEATIAKDGSVRDARVLRSVPALDAAALAAVRQWTYTSPMLNNEPVEVLMTVTVWFRLR